MGPGEWLTLVIAIGGMLAVAVAWITYRETHRSNVAKAENDRVKAIIHESVGTRLDGITSQVTNLDSRAIATNDRLDKFGDTQAQILDRLTRLDTQMEPFWQQIAMNASKVLHSPDPRRSRFDYLIEAFQTGTLTPEEDLEFRKLLYKVMLYEPGQQTDFPIRDGEQGVAALLLSTMDLVKPGGGRATRKP